MSIKLGYPNLPYAMGYIVCMNYVDVKMAKIKAAIDKAPLNSHGAASYTLRILLRFSSSAQTTNLNC